MKSIETEKKLTFFFFEKVKKGVGSFKPAPILLAPSTRHPVHSEPSHVLLNGLMIAYLQLVNTLMGLEWLKGKASPHFFQRSQRNTLTASSNWRVWVCRLSAAAAFCCTRAAFCCVIESRWPIE